MSLLSSRLDQRRGLDADAAATLIGIAAAVGVGLVVASLPPAVGFLLLVGTAAVLVGLFRPELALLALPFAVPFGEVRTLTVGGLTAGGVEAVLALVFIAWLARGLACRRVVAPSGPLLLPLAIFLAALVVSVDGARDLTAAIKEVAKWTEVLLAYALVLAFVAEAGREEGQRIARWLIVAVVAAAVLEALSGIAQSVQRIGPPSYAILGGRLWRAFGEFGQPNPFGGYINLTLMPVVSGLVGLALSPLRRGTAVLLLALGGAGSVLGMALVLSWSRGAWLGAVVGIGVVLIVWLVAALAKPAAGDSAGTRRRAAAGLALLTAVGLTVLGLGVTDLIPGSVAERLYSVREYFGGFDVLNIEVTDENFAVVERVAHWHAAAGMWADNFWTGVGAGNYASVYPEYRVPRWLDPLGHAHNLYLNLGAETGFVGLLAYGVLIGVATWHAVWIAAGATDWVARSLAIGVLGMLAASGVHQLFDYLYVHNMGVHFAILLSLGTAVHRAG